ncbi:MAG TPA: YpdA family putative bacillithiol disulfide reductase [Candidatus Avamphibacillus intestinigallinarum]|nr:YpdA family putative bacillithiol disulfide reductase [Candidatus Avamphibacillus intestinigallinarum]
MIKEKAIIVGAGPCGLSCAIELQNVGIDPLIIEKASIVNTIYEFPTHQTFFSTSEKLEIGDIAFITAKQKPQRLDALAYYRSVAERQNLRIQSFTEVMGVQKNGSTFEVKTNYKNDEVFYEADYVIMATGYYDQPNKLNIPGETLPIVAHYFKEGHPYQGQHVVVIGGKNSAIDASLELHKAGAHVTVLYRGSTYSKSVKPWILPLFDSLVQKGEITMKFNANVTEITSKQVHFQVDEKEEIVQSDFVFAMIGYRPDLALLNHIGVDINWDNGRPHYHRQTYETNIDNLYIAGVITAGFNNNKIFIENGKFHGKAIAKDIQSKQS